MRMNLSASFLTTSRKKCLLARAFACGLSLTLPACAIPNLRQPDAGQPLPADFNGMTSPENSSQLWVEEFFNDPALTRMICQALASNQELKTLDQEVAIAQNEVLARRGAFLPFVTVRAGAGLDKPSGFTPLGAAEKQLEYFPGKHFPDPLGDFTAGLNVFMPLDIWREFRNARDAATQRYFAATERRTYFVTRLVADIAESYYELMALDNRREILDQTIALQEQSLKVAQANLAAARGTELAVQRFQAEVRKNQSEKLIVSQEIIEVENRINVLVGRYPQSVERYPGDFIDLNLHTLSVGVPAQLLQNRADIRQAEREVEAAGLDVKVARAHFFPRIDISAGVGYQAFNVKYLFNTPEALVYNVAGDLVAPLINKTAIRAEYLSANARQLESVYNYQRVVLNAFTEVVNRVTKVENYRQSIENRKLQLASLKASVDVATQLFQNARAEYVEVLLAQRDLMEARIVLIDTKRQQLSAIVNAYQALGGGNLISCSNRDGCLDGPQPPSLPGVEPLHMPRTEKDSPAPPRLPAPHMD
jgi:NodT family efflux transporter outer membrane factor (OMF) lipoprotein